MSSIERLRGGGLERISWEKVYLLMDDLLNDVPVISYKITNTSKIVRGRRLESPDTFDDVRKLLYPPAKYCKTYGRCNKPGSPMLYGAIGYNLVFSELGAEIGDILGLVFLKPKRELNVCLLGALDLYRRTEGNCWLLDDTKMQIEPINKDPSKITAFLFDAFINDYFGSSGNDIIYKLTSAYSQALLESFPIIDGILYESVDHKRGTCLSIKPNIVDDDTEVTDAQIVRITNHLGYGIYDFEEVARSAAVIKSNIKWV